MTQMTTTETLSAAQSAATTQAAEVAAKTPPTAGEMAFNIAVFGLSLAASVAMGYYLFSDPSRLTDMWAWIRALPLVVQLVMWALLLPWMTALWIFSTPWPFVVRSVLVLGVLLFTMYLVFPWKP